MSVGAIGPATAALPPLGPGSIPADIQRQGKAATDAFRAGLGFERMLVAQLAKGLTSATGGEKADGASSIHAQAIPEAMTDGIMAGGGLGLARTFVPPAKHGTDQGA